MNYISTRELADKWNVSTTRIVYLASHNRIDGARLVGKSWMFPADAVKPADRRRKNSRCDQPRDFRFPLYWFNNYSQQEVEDTFTSDELALYKGEKAYFGCDYEAAYIILKGVLAETQDYAVMTGATYYLCLVCLHTQRFAEFLDAYRRIKKIITPGIPNYRDLMLVVHDIETYFSGNEFYKNEFVKAAGQKYHPSARNYLYTICAYTEIVNSFPANHVVNTAPYEIICREMESKGNWYTAMFMHCYLSVILYWQEEVEQALYHMGKALHAAIDHDNIYQVVFIYRYMPEVFTKLIARPEFAPAADLPQQFNKYFDAFKELLHHNNIYSSINDLTPGELEYVHLAAKGLSNSEVAQLKHLSVSTIAKRYSLLYQKTYTSSKKELVDVVSKSLIDYSSQLDEII